MGAPHERHAVRDGADVLTGDPDSPIASSTGTAVASEAVTGADADSLPPRCPRCWGTQIVERERTIDADGRRSAGAAIPVTLVTLACTCRDCGTRFRLLRWRP